MQKQFNRFMRLGQDGYRQHIEDNLWNYKFADEILRNELEGKTMQPLAACAYFDSDGILLGLYGDMEQKKRLREEGICEGSVWTRSVVGRNAVTICLEEHRERCVTAGAENQSELLKHYTIYFSQIQLLDVNLKNYYNATLKLGGIALFVSRPEKDALLESVIKIMAHDIGMTLNCDLQLRRQYERNQNGVIFLNSSMNRNQITATYVNDRFFSIFGSGRQQMDFANLESFFSQAENRELWEIIWEKKCVENKQVNLTFQENTVVCLITVDFWNQPGLRTSGCILSITTPQIENRKISRQIANSAIVSFDHIVGSSLVMQKVKKRAAMFAATDSNVMLLGESGVGKDVFAQAIHNASSRRDKPFIAINCGAIPRELIASELFGYEGGAFTGAKKSGNIGKFELADGGTIFLDEIGEMPLDLQATLLRLVEQKQLMRVGGSRMIDINVKIICATNADLGEMIEKRLFRADLFYRLSILTLRIPPLRDREEDASELAAYFVKKISQRIGKTEKMIIPEETKKLLEAYDWPGNVRELQNLMELIVQLYEGPEILPEYVRDNLLWRGERFKTGECTEHPNYEIRTRKKISREEIETALTQCKGKRGEAAAVLGISRKTLYRYMVQYEMK